MGRRTEEVEINGSVYRLTTLPTKRGQRLLAKMKRLAVPAVAKGIGSAAAGQALQAKGLAGLLDLNLGVGLADGVTMLFERVTEDDQQHILGELMLDAMVKPEGAEKMVKMSDVYEDHFSGRISELYKVALEALKLNYPDFWKPLSAAVSEFKKKMADDETPAVTA